MDGSFPKRVYHAEKESCVVRTPEELKALGDGWCESPADLPPPVKPEPEPIKVEVVKRKRSKEEVSKS